MTLSPRHFQRTAPPKGGDLYRQLWRVVDGAVVDAFKMHPEYINPRQAINARVSVNKRVVGAMMSFVEKSTEGGQRAADKECRGTKCDTQGGVWNRMRHLAAGLLGPRRINFTWPARLHFIRGGADYRLYLTLWLFGRRFHYCAARSHQQLRNAP